MYKEWKASNATSIKWDGIILYHIVNLEQNHLPFNFLFLFATGVVSLLKMSVLAHVLRINK
jgi:hypothetical protein